MNEANKSIEVGPMTVAKLKQVLQQYPDEMHVHVWIGRVMGQDVATWMRDLHAMSKAGQLLLFIPSVLEIKPS